MADETVGTSTAEKIVAENTIGLLNRPPVAAVENTRQSKTQHWELLVNQADFVDSDFQLDDDEGSQEDRQETNQQVKRFFYFNPRPGNRDWADFDDCDEYNACAMAKSAEEADVILFNAARMKYVDTLPARRPNQIWVMYSREPPDLPSMDALERPDLLNQVNYSRMVYSDSTWQVRYGDLREMVPPKKNYEKIFQRKRFDVAWFVSHCERPSRRMEYVRRMMSTVDVHIYGSCGNYSCGDRGYNMGGQKDECLEMLARDYKFYLSFENTLCRDYVSEKFFNLFEGVDVLPVVRGGADYQKLFPSDIFVDAGDFPSPETLGTYLKLLGKDEKNYIRMLRKKSRYRKRRHKVNFFCDLCKRAHTGKPRHFYENFYQWVRAPGNCWQPTDLDPV
ncbi:alpha-(1,3)-fucosyltransferase C [Elysia marginata]|uniref:Fucosyltransferase n=1 Tax=Elysia marginata TaxID=1093978 RepID=A0AAV4FNE3_9GAST|nr:alpha-(1,3)-fucosyltransferase C [Elysia marginata]